MTTCHFFVRDICRSGKEKHSNIDIIQITKIINSNCVVRNLVLNLVFALSTVKKKKASRGDV